MNMIKSVKYNLPDTELLSMRIAGIKLWKPDKTYVVIGQRDNVETALFTEKIIREKIPVFKRPSGGHSVVLTPKTIVISMLFPEKKMSDIKDTFKTANRIIIGALKAQSVENLNINGVSDITLKDKKIAGSSMFFDKSRLFFHAVLNISEDTENISSFLKHPATEPEYRNKRSHTEFISSLEENKYFIDQDKLKYDLEILFCNISKKQSEVLSLPAF